MILIINGTNRPENKSSVVARHVYQYLTHHTAEEVRYFSLEDLPSGVEIGQMYQPSGKDALIDSIQKEFFIPSQNWILISPEYNGSYPGILKLFIDAMSITHMADTFYHKKIGLIGISDGRAGNIRGMDHLSAIFNYLRMTVYHNKLPISGAKALINKDELLEPSASIVNAYLEDFLKWIK